VQLSRQSPSGDVYWEFSDLALAGAVVCGYCGCRPGARVHRDATLLTFNVVSGTVAILIASTCLTVLIRRRIGESVEVEQKGSSLIPASGDQSL
jgi:hypothetical protein